jgi:4-amino-4-deoxy-L-arabinose transferase-like glycosyltransferase
MIGSASLLRVFGRGQGHRSLGGDPALGVRSSTPRRVLVSAALLSGVLVWLLMRGRPEDASHTDIVLLWIAGLVCAVAGIAWPLHPRAWPASIVRAVQRDAINWLLVGCVLVVALELRVVALGQLPFTFGGDEASIATSAIAVLEGQTKDPFGTGWYSVPNLFFYLQAGSIILFGDSVVGARMLSALLGALTVLFIYLLARRLLGPIWALVAALLLASLHMHIHFSRLSANPIADPLFLVASLFFVDRAVERNRPLDAVFAGITIGLSQYFYFGSRVTPLVAVIYAIYLLIRRALNQSRIARAEFGLLQPQVMGAMALGAWLAYAPLLAYYLVHPIEFNARVNQVSIFASGWLEAAQPVFDKSATELLIDQFRLAALFPVLSPLKGWYTPSAPLLGPAAVLFSLGLVIATIWVFRREYFPLALAYWAAVGGVALTIEPSATQRLVITTPLLALLVTIGLRALFRIITRLLDLRPQYAATLAGTAVAGIIVWNVLYYFLDPSTNRRYFDENGLVATELGYYLRDLGPGYTVYFSGAPRMWYYGFQSLPFLARDARGIDVPVPWDETAPPSVSGPTVFAFLPERVDELQQVRSWFPGGELHEFRVPEFRKDGPPLVTTYALNSPSATSGARKS